MVARHRMAADGLGVMVRDSGHVIALDTAAMATAATGRPHRRKERIPPGPAAKAAAAQLLRIKQADSSVHQSSTPSTDSTVIDLSAYEQAARIRLDREVFRWWLTLATLRWGVICRYQAERHLSGQTRSVELAAIGRRVCETEWDVLDLLTGGGPR